MEPIFTGTTILGIKTGTIIAAFLGGLLRVIIRRKDGLISNALGFAVGIGVAFVATQGTVQVISQFFNIPPTDGVLTATAGGLALVGDDLCRFLMRYVREKKVS